jgi:hypothetical protein
VTNPYPVIEKRAKIYKYALDNFNIYQKSKELPLVVIHIRRGINSSHILPNELKPRTMDDEYYLEILKKIVIQKQTKTNLKIIILTDAPEETFSYKPTDKDIEKWAEFEPYRTEKGVNIQAHKFESIKEEFGDQLEIIRGGNPQFAVELMASADHFIMSRSSMSYVGALLNKNGAIYYPPNFWHKPLKNWIKIS